MNDGPHRSLPMKRYWRDLAERAAKAAFSADEIRDALPHALMNDARELPLDAIRNILGGGEQGSLFQNDRIAQLDAGRDACRGSALWNILINCAIEAVTDGLNGDPACHSALANAFAEYTRSSFRSVEEHYLREASARSARFVRDRLAEARGRYDFSGLASELLTHARPRGGVAGLPKRTGLDEGPPL